MSATSGWRPGDRVSLCPNGNESNRVSAVVVGVDEPGRPAEPRSNRERCHFAFAGPSIEDVKAPYYERRAMVPIVPPGLRPTWRGKRLKLDNYVILWEVPQWETVPRPPGDPALLRHLAGDLFSVEAVWDLTELEQAVLGGRNR